MLLNTTFPNPAKPDLNVELPIHNRAEALDYIGNGSITHVFSSFWIPARTQQFVEAHDKLLALAGMTSCGTVCLSLLNRAPNLKCATLFAFTWTLIIHYWILAIRPF